MGGREAHGVARAFVITDENKVKLTVGFVQLFIHAGHYRVIPLTWLEWP